MDLNDARLMIISPHPDDEAIGCGGLIAVAKRRGCYVFVLFMAVGSCRQLVTGSTGLSVRIEEARQAADFGGYVHEFAFTGDEFMRLDALPQKDLVDRIEDSIVQCRPDIAILPYSGSYDQDHRAVHSAAITAFRPIPRGVRHHVSNVLECEEPYTWGMGGPFQPNLYLALTDEDLAFKQQLLCRHATQVRDEPFARSLANLGRLAGLRGAEVGVPLAEAYRLLRGDIDGL